MLPPILWIGGPPCAGKTTTARGLAERYGLRAYHFDRQEPFHIYRSVPERQPAIIGFMAMTMDRRWLLRSPEEMARQTITSWGTERFPMVLEDLRRMEGEGTIIAEGAGLFPERVFPLLSRPDQAIWLVPTRELLTRVRTSRERSAADDTSDPPRALSNIIERDVLLAEHVRREAVERGLRVVEVDEETIGQVEGIVERHFSSWLS